MPSCCGYGRGLSRRYSKSSDLMHLCSKAMHIAGVRVRQFRTAANCNFPHQLARTPTSSYELAIREEDAETRSVFCSVKPTKLSVLFDGLSYSTHSPGRLRRICARRGTDGES